MIKAFILKFLVGQYIKENREIVQLTSGEDFNLYKLRNPDDVVKLLKSNMTANTLKYFEARDDAQRNIIKGSTLILKILIDGYRAVESIDDTEGLSDEKKYMHWEKFKSKIDIFKM